MIKQKICIIGNGLTGLTAALILGRLNLEVHLIATPEGEKRKDVRTTAISDSNYKSLIDLIGKKYSKIFFQSKEIDLYKEYSGEIKHFMNLSKKDENLMFLFQNEILKKIIQKKINTYKNLKTYYKKVSKIDVEKNKVFFANKKIDYDAIFVCTGSKSEIVKNIFGDRFIESKTNDIAFTSIVNHNLNIDNAKQFFLKEGPMAILPLNKNKFSFVWSVSDKFKNQNPTPLVTKKLKEILKLKSNFAISKIDCFPISFKFRPNFNKKNTLVLGEGSYNVHPVAGQGFNLIIRDVLYLNSKIKEYVKNGIQIKDSLFIEEYLRQRKPENLLFGLGINFLNNFFKFNKITEPIKKVILKDINKLNILKDVSLRVSNKGIF